MNLRIRQIKPEFWRDERMTRQALDVRLVYIGLWMEADDSGWLRWQPRQIALDLFPGLPEAEALALIRRAERSLTRAGRVVRHKCGHAVIPTFPEHQRFAGATKQVHTFFREHSEQCVPPEDAAPRVSRESPAGDPREPRPGSVQVRFGSERNGSGSVSEPLDQPVNHQPANPQPVNPSWDGDLYRLHAALTGYRPTAKQQRALDGYMRLAPSKNGPQARSEVAEAMLAEPNPTERGWLGRVGDRLKLAHPKEVARA